MDMPRPNEHHQAMSRLAGTWDGEDVMHPTPWEPQGSTTPARSVNRMAVDGFVLLRDYQQMRDGKATFSGHGVHSYDPQEGCHVLHWFDSFGMAPNIFKGHFSDNILTMISEESGDDAPRRIRLTYDLATPGKLTSKLEVSLDGENWSAFLDGVYSRQD